MTRRVCGLVLGAALAVGAVVLAGRPAWAAEPARKAQPALRGYLNLHYLYSGSAASTPVSNGLRLTGNFRFTAFSGRLQLVFRSHSWFHFQRSRVSVLESPYVNRRFVQSLYVEGRDWLVRGLVLRFGRFFPDVDYASLPLLDGGRLRLERGRWTLTAAAGRGVDVWDGKELSSDWHTALGFQYRTERLRVLLGGSSGSYREWTKHEVSGGLDGRLGRNLWLDGYAAYDAKAREMSRAGIGLSWRPETGSLHLSLQATWWRNAFDQLVDMSRPSTLHDWLPDWQPVEFRDLRLTVSQRGKKWGWRASAGLMQGARSGWVASAFLRRSVFGPLSVEVGGQVMDTDFIHYYSVQGSLLAVLRSVTLELRSQARLYQWQPRPSDYKNSDNFSELRLEVPAGRHLYLGLSAGVFVRELGDETFRPQLEANIIYRF